MNYCGVYIASVINNNDPLSQGRAQLQIPQILGQATSNWAAPLGNFSSIAPAAGNIVYAMFIGGNVSFPVYFPIPSTGGNLSLTGTLTVAGNITTTALGQMIASGDVITNFGNVIVKNAGKGVTVKEGSNCKQGTATLVAGQAVVSNTSVTATSRIFLTSQVDGGTPGFLRVSTRTAGTSFTIQSSSVTDTSTVAYEIFEAS